jgi:hypothetical protein
LLQSTVWSQNSIAIKAKIDIGKKTILVEQEISYFNSSDISINEIYLNDWNNAYSSKNSALAKRFSDEFIRAFHLSKEEDRGYTKIINTIDSNFKSLEWNRNSNPIDVIKIILNEPIKPNTSQLIKIIYELKIPNQKFTNYGFHENGNFYLKNCFLSLPRFENCQFILESNENLDDISSSITAYKIELEVPENHVVFSDLKKTLVNNKIVLQGESKQNYSIILQTKENINYKSYKNETIEVISNLEDKRLNEIQIAQVINKVTAYVKDELRKPDQNQILVSKEDYDRNPFYGVNQLPSFINPFPDEFIFEVKFLKTYLHKLLNEELKIHHRKDHWISEGIQQFVIMNYIDFHYPKFKMLGNLSKIKILKGYNIINVDFNDQFYYVYLLMARKNLDQPIGNPKNSLIKFNEQIAGKYRAGLSLRYLDAYLQNNSVSKSIKEFIILNKDFQTTTYDFKYILQQNATDDIDWFFNTLVNTNKLIDYKFSKIKKEKEFIKVTIKNKTNTNVPIPLYGFKNDSIVYKKWLVNVKKDTTLIVPRNNIDKLVLNYKTEVPENNIRNNWYSLKGFFFNHRPLKANFLKDLENPYYNQVFYVPEFGFNLYDGLTMGLKIDNKSMLNKPFIFGVTPAYATNTKSLIGSVYGAIDQNIREPGKLYNIRYTLSASTSHYAQNASYTNINPSITFRFRPENLRTNKNEYIQIKQLYINREETKQIKDRNTENYNVFNVKYGNFQNEATKFFSLKTDFQIANSFGKIATEMQYRKTFDDNRQISLRFYAGTFMYRSTKSEFFSFGLDRPNDYLFEYNLLGRSETTGIYSQQFVFGEGGFKSKLLTRFANQWMTTANASFNIWNWIQVYSDAGLIKNNFSKAQFVYDSGIHLNLVPDYFELFFPIQSSNGFELGQDNYGQKIRFVITLSPRTLTSLFTRKWF